MRQGDKSQENEDFSVLTSDKDFNLNSFQFDLIRILPYKSINLHENILINL